MLGFLKRLLNPPRINFRELIENGAVILDVRTPAEFKSGHLKGARNIPLDSIRQKTAELKKLNKPVITVCRSGSRSGLAKSILKSAGLEVYNGGAWTLFESKIR